jgi:hypothetical protein
MPTRRSLHEKCSRRRKHDPDAAVLAVFCGESAGVLAARVEQALGHVWCATCHAPRLLGALSRLRGGVVTAASLSRGVEIANAWGCGTLVAARER